MKLSGVRCIYWGEIVTLLDLLVSIPVMFVLITLDEGTLGFLSEYNWVLALPRCIPPFLFWQSCKRLKDRDSHFKKAMIFPIIVTVLILISYIKIPYSWWGGVNSTFEITIEMIMFYHLFAGLSELAKQDANLLLAKKLRRLFWVKLIMWPSIVIVPVTVYIAVSSSMYSITESMPSRLAFQLVFSTLSLVSLLFYSYILKWLYRADKELNV